MAITNDDIEKVTYGARDYEVLGPVSALILSQLDIKLGRLGRFNPTSVSTRDFDVVEILRTADPDNPPVSREGVQLQIVFKHRKTGKVMQFGSYYVDAYATAMTLVELAQ